MIAVLAFSAASWAAPRKPIAPPPAKAPALAPIPATLIEAARFAAPNSRLSREPGLSDFEEGAMADPVELLKRAQQWRSTEGDDPIALAALSIAFQRLQMSRDRLATLELLVRSHPTIAFAWKLYGSLLEAQGRSSESEAAYAQALSIEPRLPGVAIVLASALASRNDQPSAIEKFRLAIVAQDAALQTLVAKDARVWDALGRAYELQGLRDEAIRCYAQAVALDSRAVDAWSRLGILRLAKDDKSGAQQAFEGANRTGKDGFAVRLALGDLYAEHGRHDQAVALYQSAASADDGSAEAWTRLAKALPLAGAAPAREAEAWKRVLQLDPSSQDSWVAFGVACERQGDLAKAALALEKAAAMTPANVEGWLRLAKLDLQRRSPKEALSALEEALKASPGDGRVWLGKGDALLQLGTLDAAVDSYRRATDMAGSAVIAWKKLADLYETRRDTATLMQALKNLVALDDADDGAWLKLGGLLEKANDREKALAAYRRVASLRPDRIDSWTRLGRYAEQLQDWETTALAFGKATALDATSGENWLPLAKATAIIGRHRESVAAFREALSRGRGPTDVSGFGGETLKCLAEALTAEKLVEPAIEAYRKALRLLPDDLRAMEAVAALLRERKQWDEVAAQYQSIVRLSPDSADAWTQLGIALLFGGKSPEAIQVLERATVVNPRHAPAWSNLAIAHAKVNDFTKARATVAGLRALDPVAADKLQGIIEAAELKASAGSRPAR